MAMFGNGKRAARQRPYHQPSRIGRGYAKSRPDGEARQAAFEAFDKWLAEISGRAGVTRRRPATFSVGADAVLRVGVDANGFRLEKVRSNGTVSMIYASGGLLGEGVRMEEAREAVTAVLRARMDHEHGAREGLRPQAERAGKLIRELFEHAQGRIAARIRRAELPRSAAFEDPSQIALPGGEKVLRMTPTGRFKLVDVTGHRETVVFSSVGEPAFANDLSAGQKKAILGELRQAVAAERQARKRDYADPEPDADRVQAANGVAMPEPDIDHPVGPEEPLPGDLVKDYEDLAAMHLGQDEDGPQDPDINAYSWVGPPRDREGPEPEGP